MGYSTTGKGHRTHRMRQYYLMDQQETPEGQGRSSW